MKESELKKRNIIFLLVGAFFSIGSGVIVSFFLPFFLKEQGLNILQIGFLLTLGVAFSSLIVSVIFSHLQKSLKLKKSLLFSAFFAFLSPLAVFVSPNSLGAVFATFSEKVGGIIEGVATQVTLQHNTNGSNHRRVSSWFLIGETLSFGLALGLSYILIKQFGFIFSFLIFSLIAIPTFFFYSKIEDKTRFKIKGNYKLPKVDRKLKIFLLSGIVYNFALSASFVLVITFLVTDLFSKSIGWIAILFAALYISMGVTAFLFRNFLDKANWIKTSILGMFTLMFSAVLVIVSQNVYVVFAAMILEGIGAGVWVPSHNAQYWKMTKPALREKVSGYYLGWQSFWKTLAPLFGGWLVITFGILSPFYFKAGIALISVVIYLYVLKG